MKNNFINLPDTQSKIFEFPRKNAIIIKKVKLSQRPRAYRIEKQTTPILSHDSIEIFKNSPYIVTWKSSDLVYQGCSPKFAHLIQLTSELDIIGKRDANLLWQKEAHAFLEEDHQVLEGHILSIVGKYSFFDKTRMILVKKIPILNASENIVGILNFMTEFHNECFSNIISTLNEQGFEIPSPIAKAIKSLCFENELPFSSREEDCAFYLLKGLSSKEIGKYLGISNRTVEIHLNSLKEKLNCNKTTSLIVKLIQMGW